MRRLLLSVLFAGLTCALAAQDLRLPMKDGSVKFAVIGDTGTGDSSQLEPLFIKHGVNVVFTGHEHFYERIKPQQGIQYFIAGSSAKLRRGDIAKTTLTAFGYDEGFTFMLVEVAGDEMYFQTITEKGQTVDTGVITKGANNRLVTPAPPAR